MGAISIQIQEPIFEGQTKTKLGSTYMWEKQVKAADGTSSVDRGPTIRTFVNDFVTKNLNDYLHRHMEIVPVIEDKIKASQAEREEIAGVQKKSRERAKKTAVYNKKLRDCRYHFCDTRFPKGMEDQREKTSIFITEGDSASGTITKVRNANNQAVFSLRGKPINCFKESRKRVAENEELNLLIAALGVEEDLDNLRYNNIIVATDADDDGMHIRMGAHLHHEVLSGAHPPRTRVHPPNAPVPRPQQERHPLLLLHRRARQSRQGFENRRGDHPLQRPGGNLLE